MHRSYVPTRAHLIERMILMSKSRLLIVHPEPSALALLSSMLKSLGPEIDEAVNDRMAVRLMERGGVDLLVAGVDPMDADALELLSYMRRKYRQVPVILLFMTPNPERAKEALRQGALAVLKYPVPATELRASVTQALGPLVMSPLSPTPASSSAILSLAAAPGFTPPPLADQLARDLGMLGNDPSLRQALELAATIATTRVPVLIIGEHGTGKSLLARAIHKLCFPGDCPFTTLDCTAKADALDLDPIAPPTGFIPDWSSQLAQAEGGTLFLKEVAALSEEHQLQLLRALQDSEFEGVLNGRSSRHGDVRFLMSTSENLLTLVEQGKFRQDLYHRMSVICLKLPPLRHRGGDIEQLAESFRVRYAIEFGKNVVGFTRDALDFLNKYEWPGNVRELEGVVQRGVVLCQGTRITSGHLSPSLRHSRTSRATSIAHRPHLPMNIRPLKEALEEPEKRIIIQALQALNWNRQETARVLDINRTTLYKKMKKYGLLVDGPIWVN